MVELEGEVQRTKVIYKSLNPVWNEKFDMNVYVADDQLSRCTRRPHFL